MIAVLNLAGALGLFLYGMKVMSDGLSALAGSGLRATLAKLTSNRFKGVFTGVFITAAIQSSSATTLMVVSFVNAGLLSLKSAIPVIMGANIGTTFTAWLIALLGFGVSMSAIAIPAMAVGFLLVSSKNTQAIKWGQFLIGFCLLFIGLDFMKGSFPDLKNNPEIYRLISDLSGFGLFSIFIFLGFGTFLTIILQSSSATMAITIVAASQGWLPFEAAVAIILGENVGTTITANLAALVADANARRAAFAHLFVNLFGVCWALLFLGSLIDLVSSFTILLEGTSPMVSATAIPLGLASFHSVFNILNTSLLIWFVAPISTLVSAIVPDRAAPEVELTQSKFLTKSAMKYPETALEAFENESRRLFSNAIYESVAHGLSLSRRDIESRMSDEEVVRAGTDLMVLDIDSFFTKRIEPLFEELLAYSSKILAKHELKPEQAKRLLALRLANRRLPDILKNVAVLYAILSRSATVSKPAFQSEVDSIRIVIVRLLRAFFALRDLPVSQRKPDTFNTLRKEANKLDNQIFSEVDALIRTKTLSAAEGTALINASAITRHLTKDLVKTARALYSTDSARAA
ncbi:phosphate:Na+ symporter [Roseibium hamelinense]|uniref:Phosphate:Na+ symporter n=1 Tax=Roseibium hamelinense TaxID=150831 RepID=A0A562T2G3_9HYPH|nr:Na/Pi cotransporter family protein [Roseibium hamelinense]MTI44714.1 Na/Pi cotransporter family protein [Roseibium hamelinense]TWI87344.1 phosphate:Na+ symporter [Roseibium hamelinense]